MNRSASIVLVLLGVVALVAAVQVVHFGDQPEYYHSISPGPTTETAVNATLAEYGQSITREEALVVYSDLSGQGQRVIWETMAAEGWELRLRGVGNGIAGLQYGGDAIRLGLGRYVLEYQGEFYYLSAYGDTGFDGLFELMAGLVLFGVGIPLVLVGLVRLDELQVTSSVLMAIAVVTALSIAEFGWFSVTGLVGLLGLGFLAGAISAAFTWICIRSVVEWVDMLPPEQQLKRRGSVAAAFGSVTLLLALVFTLGVLALSGLLNVAMVAFLAFAIPTAIAWHGLDRILVRTVQQRFREG